jgi:hypothetical protein
MTRAGDIGVIAELARTPVGAAWARRMRDNELRPLDDPAVPCWRSVWSRSTAAGASVGDS